MQGNKRQRGETREQGKKLNKRWQDYSSQQEMFIKKKKKDSSSRRIGF